MTQFYSRIDTIINGDVYNIPFSYINEQEIEVYLDDKLYEDWEFLNDSQIELKNLAPDISKQTIVSIRRNTNIIEKVVEYTNNTLLNKENLNLSQDQLLYAVQEIHDNNTQFNIDLNATVDEKMDSLTAAVEEKVERVTEAVDQLHVLDEAVTNALNAAETAIEQVSLATEQKELATEQANIAIENTQLVASTANKALDDIETLTTNSTQEINSLADSIKENATDIIKTTRLQMGMTVVLDKVLSFEESQGLALQGTYVYKTAVAGERYGYPDFYEKYVGFKNNATATQTTLGSSTITIYTNANGLQFYNIADKGVIDTWFNSTGVADFYGIDEANERIFLPRNNKFWQFTTNTDEVNDYVEAGLPTHTHTRGTMEISGWAGMGESHGAGGAFNPTHGSAVGGNTSTGGSTDWGFDFYASRTWTGSTSAPDNALYGKSNTVQPASSKKLLYYVVGNTVSDTSWVDVVTQVQGGVKDLEDKTNEGIERLKASSNALTTTQITNCITEIPQDIKLELNNGVLTLKAGSKVYVPNGFEADGTTKKFDEIIIENDVVRDIRTGTENSQAFIFYKPSEQIIDIYDIGHAVSGDTDILATSTYHAWYDTNNNLCKIIKDNLSSYALFSLPIALCTRTNGNISSIDQTFNGFGYIGSTAFVTKGVKGLIPNGRNEDGTLNNIEFTTDKIIMDTGVYTSDYLLGENLLQPYFYLMYAEQPTKPTFQNGEWFNTEENILYRITNGVATQLKAFAIGKVVSTGNEGSVVSFTPKQPFRAVDYSDKPTVSGWAMPSNKYINLTVGASGTTYTAPANGLFCAYCHMTNTNAFLDMNVGGIYNVRIKDSAWNSSDVAQIIPVKKGSVLHLVYSGVNFYSFRFIYAEGEV